MNLRHLAASCAVTAVALGGAALPSLASADEPTCPEPAALQASVDEAKAAVSTAKADVKAANRPLGALVSAKRHEAKAEVVQSRTELKSLRQQVKSAPKASRKELRQQMRQERRDIAHARNLLVEKRALLASIKTDRRAAHTALKAAKASLAQLEEQQETCSAS